MAVTNQAIVAGSALLLSAPAAGTGASSNATPTLVNVGSFTANGATAVVVADAGTTAASIIIFTLATVGGTPAGAPFLSAITAGTGFSVKAVAGDTSTYNYFRIG